MGFSEQGFLNYFAGGLERQLHKFFPFEFEKSDMSGCRFLHMFRFLPGGPRKSEDASQIQTG